MGSTGSCGRGFERAGIFLDRISGFFWINRIGVGDEGAGGTRLGQAWYFWEGPPIDVGGCGVGLGLAHEEEAGGFVLGFLVFEVGVGVGDDAGAGVEVDGVVLADGGADGDVD